MADSPQADSNSKDTEKKMRERVDKLVLLHVFKDARGAQHGGKATGPERQSGGFGGCAVDAEVVPRTPTHPDGSVDGVDRGSAKSLGQLGR